MTLQLIKYAAIGNGTGTNPTGAAGGDLVGTYPNPTVSKISTTGITTGAISGFPLYYGSSTTVLVGFPNANAPTSICRDKADAAFITQAAGNQVTITVTTNGSALGDDSFTGPGTVAVNNATAVTGTSTTFTTSFGVRTCTGTITSSSTTVTGTSTKFLSEFAVNDLIGTTTNSKGFYRITAIASDTSLTISSTPGAAFAGETPKCIEQPTISITGDGNSPHQVNTITTDTALALTEVSSGGALSGASYFIGRRYARAAVSAGQFLYVWVGSGGSGTTYYVSTQRTTPYGLTGYTTSIRRLGTILLDSSGNVLPFEQSGMSNLRSVFYALPGVSNNNRLLSSGTATSWADVVANTVAPPSTVSLMLTLQIFSASTSRWLYVRPRNAGGSATATSAVFAAGIGNASAAAATTVVMGCDNAQGIQYAETNAADASYIDCYGYVEQV